MQEKHPDMINRLIIYGGSFDPIHHGHYFMAEQALRTVQAEEVHFVLAKNPRWKDKKDDGSHRLQMLKLYLQDVTWARVDEYELHREDEVNYSIDTIQYFITKYPGTKLYFLIGMDQVEKFHLWKDAASIASLVQLLVYHRPEYPKDHENIELFHMQVIEGPDHNISSTDIRLLKSLQTKKAVLDYIAHHHLYYMHKIEDFISHDRLKHSISVASLAYDIAVANHLDPNKAYLTGLLHDIGKELPVEERQRYMEEAYGNFIHFPKWLHHQFVGALIAKDAFGVQDDLILKAIESHATGNGDMSWLAKIIYSADKIEPTRDFDSRPLIEQCLADYEKGFIAVLKDNRDFLLEKRKDIYNPLTQACFARYLKE